MTVAVEGAAGGIGTVRVTGAGGIKHVTARVHSCMAGAPSTVVWWTVPVCTLVGYLSRIDINRTADYSSL